MKEFLRKLKYTCLLIMITTFTFIFAEKECLRCGKKYPDNHNFCEICGDTLRKMVKVPSVIGKNKDEAIKVLKDLKFDMEIAWIHGEPVEAYKVAMQTPAGRTNIREGSLVTLYIVAALPEPKWVKNIMSPDGWPIEGIGVARILIGDSLSKVIDTLAIGQPDQKDSNILYYRWENNKFKISFKKKKVDTITVQMANLLREELNQPLEIIKNKLPKSNTIDSTMQIYPKNGITFLLQSDTIIGFKIFKPKKESGFRKFWTGFKSYFRGKNSKIPNKHDDS